jgi:hypothetical protein
VSWWWWLPAIWGTSLVVVLAWWRIDERAFRSQQDRIHDGARPGDDPVSDDELRAIFDRVFPTEEAS